MHTCSFNTIFGFTHAILLGFYFRYSCSIRLLCYPEPRLFGAPNPSGIIGAKWVGILYKPTNVCFSSKCLFSL
ncbi:hypothetical protein FRX31_023125 [Thalictrum thalictroides]|uniref:Uncharacterized protein n=1 Tax=Thalictrum thalictroides TaxID=46969 RepID=A0A7J6VST5_THATH|nr:hypothetical protein FRX31_023125 [Thalictrum thalictroides]